MCSTGGDQDFYITNNIRLIYISFIYTCPRSLCYEKFFLVLGAHLEMNP